MNTNEAKTYNVDYALDNAERYFRIVSLQQISQKMKEFVSRGDVEEGEKLCSNYRRPASKHWHQPDGPT